MHTHFARNGRDDLVSVLQTNSEHGVGKSFCDFSILFYGILLGHVKRAAKLSKNLLKINLAIGVGHTSFQLTTTAHQTIVLTHGQVTVDLLQGIQNDTNQNQQTRTTVEL